MNRDKKRDIRLRLKFGISLADYDAMLAAQNGTCAICHEPPKRLALSVDHDRKAKYLKIVSTQGSETWTTRVFYRGVEFLAKGKTRSDALRTIRGMLQKASVRGLLCWLCNTGLRKFLDSPERLASASEYMKRATEPPAVFPSVEGPMGPIVVGDDFQPIEEPTRDEIRESKKKDESMLVYSFTAA